MNIVDILPYFRTWKRAGNGRFMASCPMPDHSDSDPSVSICQDSVSGKILMFCWGCNSKGPELVAALGLTNRDLQGDPGHPEAVRITSQVEEIPEEELTKLDGYIHLASDNIIHAEGYIADRFGLSIEDALDLRLGVDTGEHSFLRPEGYEAFNSGVPHLIIPFLDPDRKPVGMQGRRLVPGEPRWRSKSGSGWSKIGCFAWELDGPVIITEGPSDALSVVGKAYLPALAVRGASLTNNQVAEQIKSWLGTRQALIIGDSGEAGQKFTQELSEKTGIPSWKLPEEYSDLCDFLGDGGDLSVAITWATSPEAAPEPVIRTPAEIAADLRERILNDLAAASYDEELKAELRAQPDWLLRTLFAEIIANTGHGQIGITRAYVGALQRALRDRPPGGGGGHGDDDHFNRNPNNLPEIMWNPEDQLQITEESVRDAMNVYEAGEYYQAAPGLYVKVIREDLINLKEAGIKSMLSQMGHWRVMGGARELGHVPFEAAKMISDPSWSCDIPIIKRRVEVPFMLEDGNIVSSTGFHEESGVYLLPRSNDRIIVPDVPEIITNEHIDQAKRIFKDVVEGFVFKDDCSDANLIAMTLTSPLRELFKHSPMVPLLTSTAPQSGSGKGTSIRVPLSTAGVGPYSLGTTAYNGDENEFEKKLVGKLLKKSTYIFLDNIRSQVNSAVLEQMLTAANYDGRTLGFSEVNSLSTLVLWVSTLQSTGSFNRDLTRRCVPVELIKNYKGKWAHKNIDSYLADMRGQLIWACFVSARKWMQDGGQISEARLDGYGGWTEVIGGILENVLGYEGFLGNLASFRKQQDEVSMTIDGILERWLERYGEEEHTARFAVEDYDDTALHHLLGLKNPVPRQVLSSMTRQLEAQRGHIIKDTHIWTPTGMKDAGAEGIKKHFRCAPLPKED